MSAGETNETGNLGAWSESPELRLETRGGMTRVRVDGLAVYSFGEEDDASRKMAIAGLAESGLFEQAEIGKAFDLAPSTVSYFASRFRDGGAALLFRERGGVPGPRQLSVKEIAKAQAWKRAGLTVGEVTERLNKGRKKTKKVSRSTVGRFVKGIEPEQAGSASLFPEPEETAPEEEAPREAAPACETPAEAVVPAEALVPAAPREVQAAPTVGSEPTPMAAPEAAPESEVHSAVDSSRDSDDAEPITRESKVAGAMVAHAALNALGLVSALEASHARFRPARVFDLLRTAAVIVFGTLLRYRSIEDMRHLVRHDVGALLGIRRAPEIRTLRRKLEEIADDETGFDGGAFSRDLGRSVLRAADAPGGVFFFDDHFKPYYGKEPLAKGWDAKRRIGAPGIEDVYIHDAKGRAILFVPLEAPTSLSRAMPLALAELRKIAAQAPSLAVFDRGGFSRDLFRSLVHSENRYPRIDFLTYLVARKKGRELPIEAFHEVTLETEDGPRKAEIAESTLAMRGLERPLRLIVLLDRKKGKQIPILTSDEKTDAAKLVELLRSRWRQENSFKYLVGELAIDSLISRDMDTAEDRRLVENPERAAQRSYIAEARAELASYDAAIAAALDATGESMRGFKAASATLRLEREVLLGQLEVMEEDLRMLPAKVRRSALEPGARIATPRTKRRVFVNGLKLLVHNAEKWLADLIGPGPYGAHALPILRALFDQPGRLRFERGRVLVSIRPLDTPRYQACVERLLRALNERRPTLLDTGLRIEFEIPATAKEGTEGAMS